MTHELLKEMPEGISRLPITLQESLNKLKTDETLMRNFPDELMQHYLENKYFEQKIAVDYKG